MIILMLGETGAGKTSLAYAMAIQEMFNRKRLKSAQNLVYQLNIGGYTKLILPDDHLVYTETFLLGRLFGHRPKVSYLCNGKKFGLPTGDNDVDFYPPFSFIVYDESQKDVDSRNFRNLQDYVKRGWETNRHIEYTLLYISQFGNVDKVLRGLANKIYYVVDKYQQLSKGKYKHVQSCWEYYEFNSFEEYENWKSAGKPKRAELLYLFDGDIIRCYDDHAFLPVWFKGRENADFTKVKTKPVMKTIDSFNDFLKNIGDEP